jgi:hypothetical protein
MSNREQATDLEEEVTGLRTDVSELEEQVAGPESAPVEITRPIIIDLGKQRPKRIKRLKRGQGRLWDEVLDVCEEVGDQLGGEAEDKILVPIVMIYRKKPGKNSVSPLFPLTR